MICLIYGTGICSVYHMIQTILEYTYIYDPSMLYWKHTYRTDHTSGLILGTLSLNCWRPTSFHCVNPVNHKWVNIICLISGICSTVYDMIQARCHWIYIDQRPAEGHKKEAQDASGQALLDTHIRDISHQWINTRFIQDSRYIIQTLYKVK